MAFCSLLTLFVIQSALSTAGEAAPRPSARNALTPRFFLPRATIRQIRASWNTSPHFDPFGDTTPRRVPVGEAPSVGGRGPFGRVVRVSYDVPVVKTQLSPPFYIFTQNPQHEGWGGVSFELHRRGLFEDAIVDRVARDVSKVCSSSGGLFIDVGTNIGFFTLLAASWGCKVFGFEANSDLHELVRNSAALNGFDDRVTVIPYGAGPKREKVFVNNKRTCPGCSSLSTQDDPDSVEVQLVDISSYITEAPVFMKIDIDGYEIGALEGAMDFIRRYRLPYGYVELNPWWWHRGDGVTIERGERLLMDLHTLGYLFSHTDGTPYSFHELIADVRKTVQDSPYHGVDTNVFFHLHQI